MSDICKTLDTININYYIKDNYIEIVPNGINKFTASEIILEKEKIKVSEMISIGCSSNDYELVKNAGIGICIKNGDNSIKKIAKYTTKKSNTAGVKEVINKYWGA